ncbi:hypothetical protein HYFRA_00005133 [Hymenoscyphus fraxineus]|uniref:Uncharacterized protein n=1 Tax=Hymenoscyphus fraxineus TaxID=746836 RepID=A0A9N9Q047_9HELO|nr:hypothetical protein HYFRA_00005133 [Hymenoscyphus fraxineus]
MQINIARQSDGTGVGDFCRSLTGDDGVKVNVSTSATSQRAPVLVCYRHDRGGREWMWPMWQMRCSQPSWSKAGSSSLSNKPPSPGSHIISHLYTE